ncbi:MAG: hypothetical protein AB1758_02610 [Candidatus Eremiobacterota bacterium]
MERVCLRYGTPEVEELDRLSLADAERYMQEGHFKAGSMKPKVEAVMAYPKAGGKWALITNPENLKRALEGQTFLFVGSSRAPAGVFVMRSIYARKNLLPYERIGGRVGLRA